MSELAALLQYSLNGLFTSSVYLLVALGLTLIFGVMKIADFAQGALYMLGAYVCLYSVQSLGLNYFAGVGLATLGVGLFSALNGWLVYRPLKRVGEGATFIGSLGLLLILQNLALLIFSGSSRSIRSPFGAGLFDVYGAIITYHRAFVFATALVLAGALWLFLQRTRIGHALQALAQDREAAVLMGIPIERVATFAFFIAGALAAAAGALVSPVRDFNPLIGIPIILKSFAIVIVGGMGSLAGALWCSLLIGVSENLVAAYIASELSDLLAFALLLAILFLRPQGLFGRRAGL